MSISYRTYVGPYARCAVERIEVEKQVRKCPNAACENNRRMFDYPDPFCRLCGAAIVPVVYTALADAIDDYEVSEAIDEALCTPSGDEYKRWMEQHGAHLWLPNRSMPGRDPSLEEREVFSLAEITPKQVDAEILQFQITFEGELRELRTRYGNLTLRWGIIQDYS